VEPPISNKDLRAVDIFAGLSDSDLGLLAQVCRVRIYQAGEHCGVQGEMIDELRIVGSGRVAVEMQIEATPYPQTLNIASLTGGSVFAWSALVAPHVIPASTRCVEGAQVLCIKAADLQRIFEARPPVEHTVMKNLATVVSARLRDSWTQLARVIAEMIKRGR